MIALHGSDVCLPLLMVTDSKRDVSELGESKLPPSPDMVIFHELFQSACRVVP